MLHFRLEGLGDEAWREEDSANRSSNLVKEHYGTFYAVPKAIIIRPRLVMSLENILEEL